MKMKFGKYIKALTVSALLGAVAITAAGCGSSAKADGAGRRRS